MQNQNVKVALHLLGKHLIYKLLTEVHKSYFLKFVIVNIGSTLDVDWNIMHLCVCAHNTQLLY